MSAASVSIDPAFVFVLTLVVIVLLWSAWNRWEGEKLRRKIAAERRSDTLGDSDPD